MGLLKVLLIMLGFGLAFWGIFSFAPREIRIPAVFFLIIALRFYGSDTFRNWRLRRKLERISRNNIKRMENGE